MGETFLFGGVEYHVERKMLLTGMYYYRVLRNLQTNDVVYLLCYPES